MNRLYARQSWNYLALLIGASLMAMGNAYGNSCPEFFNQDSSHSSATNLPAVRDTRATLAASNAKSVAELQTETKQSIEAVLSTILERRLDPSTMIDYLLHDSSMRIARIGKSLRSQKASPHTDFTEENFRLNALGQSLDQIIGSVESQKRSFLRFFERMDRPTLDLTKIVTDVLTLDRVEESIHAANKEIAEARNHVLEIESAVHSEKHYLNLLLAGLLKVADENSNRPGSLDIKSIMAPAILMASRSLQTYDQLVESSIEILEMRTNTNRTVLLALQDIRDNKLTRAVMKKPELQAQIDEAQKRLDPLVEQKQIADQTDVLTECYKNICANTEVFVETKNGIEAGKVLGIREDGILTVQLSSLKLGEEALPLVAIERKNILATATNVKHGTLKINSAVSAPLGAEITTGTLEGFGRQNGVDTGVVKYFTQAGEGRYLHVPLKELTPLQLTSSPRKYPKGTKLLYMDDANRWYEGTIVDFNPLTNKHYVNSKSYPAENGWYTLNRLQSR